MDNMGGPPVNGQFNSPRPPVGFPPQQPVAGFPGQPPMPFQQQQQQPPAFDSMGSRYPASPVSNYNQPGMMPSPQPMAPPQQQQARRLDPDQMPSAIQVMEDDKRTRSGPFATNQKGLIPPLVTTRFVTQDQGNCGPRFVRSSMYR